MNYTFAPLPYPADALEPVIDKTTMEIHHGRHHKTYFDNFIAAIKDTPLADETLEAIFAGISKHPAAVRNNGGGYYNHNLYWNVMSPNGGGEPEVTSDRRRSFHRPCSLWTDPSARRRRRRRLNDVTNRRSTVFAGPTRKGPISARKRTDLDVFRTVGYTRTATVRPRRRWS